MQAGEHKETRTVLANVIDSSHGTATAKLLSCFLVIVAQGEKGTAVRDDLLKPYVSLSVLPHMLLNCKYVPPYF